MRIAMIVGKFPVCSETFVLNQIRGLVGQGHDVEIFCLHGQPSDFDRYQGDQVAPFLKKTTYAVAPNGSWIKDAIYLLRQFMSHPAQARALTNVQPERPSYGRRELLFRGTTFFGRKPYDIVYCQFGSIGLDMLPLRALPMLNQKFVVAFRGADLSSFVRSHGQEVYADLFRQADAVLPNSDHFRDVLLRMGCPEDRIKLVRSGINVVDFAFRQRSIAEDGIVRFIFVGRLVAKKGLDDCLKAFSLVRHGRENFHLTIVGDGPLKQEVGELIEIFNLQSHVTCLGAKDPVSIQNLLNQHHIFISANKTPTSGDVEGVPNTLKEAAAVGLPLISTRHGGIPEFVKDGWNGYLVDEGDIEGLAARIVHCMGNSDSWAELGGHGREGVLAEYDAGAWNDRLIKEFERLLDDA